MVFVETYAFTKHIYDCFDEEEYREFQSYLMKHPEKGVLIPGTGGLRKIKAKEEELGLFTIGISQWSEFIY